MEREKKNPFVTRIELDETERKLSVKINDVDRKHDDNYSEVLKLVAVSEKTNEYLAKSTERMNKSFDNFALELKEGLKKNNENYFILSEKVRDHDEELREHTKFIKSQKEISDSKKGHLLKWVSVLSAIFVALLAGIFGVVEVLIPHLLGGK